MCSYGAVGAWHSRAELLVPYNMRYFLNFITWVLSFFFNKSFKIMHFYKRMTRLQAYLNFVVRINISHMLNCSSGDVWQIQYFQKIKVSFFPKFSSVYIYINLFLFSIYALLNIKYQKLIVLLQLNIFSVSLKQPDFFGLFVLFCLCQSFCF